MCEIAVRLTFSALVIPSQAVTIQRPTPEIRDCPSKEDKFFFLNWGSLLFCSYSMGWLPCSSPPYLQVRMTISVCHEDLYILETVGLIRHQESKYPERFLDFFFSCLKQIVG
jgi:hypothetical protein